MKKNNFENSLLFIKSLRTDKKLQKMHDQFLDMAVSFIVHHVKCKNLTDKTIIDINNYLIQNNFFTPWIKMCTWETKFMLLSCNSYFLCYLQIKNKKENIIDEICRQYLILSACDFIADNKLLIQKGKNK